MCTCNNSIMLKRLKYILMIAAAAALQACIRNDIPYPVVELAITSVSGEGFTCASSDINSTERTAVIHLDETTDISKVVISEIGVTDGAVPDVSFPGTFDMRSELHVILELYQQYEWIIMAEQEISRTFRVEGQIGNAEIDAEKREVRVSVPEYLDIKTLEILEMKLGPEGITTMDHSVGETLWFDENSYGSVNVSYHDVSETWYIYVEKTAILANLSSAVPGTRVMWLSGSGVPDTDLGFRYRKSDESAWTDVADEDITVTGGAMEAYVGGLEPETEYEVQAYSGENVSESVTLTTGAEVQLPNSDFEDWATLDITMASGSSLKGVVCPYLSQADAFWGTGNPGANMASAVLTDKTEDKRPDSQGNYTAHLESKFASLFGIGKFASGNIFVGEYFETIIASMSGVVGFGRPFAERPTGLHGWMKYTQGNITHTNEKMYPDGVDVSVGAPDSGIIYIALGTWTPDEYGLTVSGTRYGTSDIPVCVYTQIESSFFDKDSEDVVAYGELVLDKTVENWQEFNIELDWKNLDVNPTHIIIVCTSSRYGDYFIGSTDSEMWVDDFELLYDKVGE